MSSLRSKLLRISTTLAILLAIVVLPLYSAKVFQKTDYTDFSVYHLAATRMKAGDWERIYTREDGASPFRYAPATLPLFRPFAEASATPARMIWFYLQFAWFGLGFLLIHRSLRAMKTPDAGAITALSALFILRFILDCFTIGQISSFLFLGFCGGLLGWVLGRPWLAGSSLFPPALFKIGPGFLYFLFFSARRRRLARAWSAAAGLFIGLSALVGLWIASLGGPWLGLWKNWLGIVAADSEYYDASHYGSQSLKSALLRLARSGLISDATALSVFGAGAVLGCAGLIALWLFRRPRSLRGRGLFFALGLFPYLWFMPETFKYSLTALAIPVALLLSAAAPTRLNQTALAFGFLSLSLPGKDIVGDGIFFFLQRSSFPFLATLLLGLAVLQEALRASVPSRLGRNLREILLPEPIGPWPLPAETQALASPGPLGLSLLAPLPMDRGARVAPRELERFLKDHLSKLSGTIGYDFEILLLPYGDRVSGEHPLFIQAQATSQEMSQIRFVPETAPGRIEALRNGFLHARGKRIGFANLEQPCDPEFYLRAMALMEATGDSTKDSTRRAQAPDLVRADRRDARTRFRVPVRLLSLVYGRHRMGLAFNRVVRFFLPIQARDTHSGTLLMSSRLARRVFALHSSAGFLFDLEISLIARGHSATEASLPVTLWLSEEKGFLRMLKETVSILVGLPLLAASDKRGRYRELPRNPVWITADDWGMSPGVNRGILALARLGIVRRVSAMADSRYLRDSLPELLSLPGIQIGLHFDLTSKGRSPGSVLLEWLLVFSGSKRGILRRKARDEFSRQLGLLRRAGVAPAYLDGHHHIHLVPGILDSIADLAREAGIRQVRLPEDPRLWLSTKFPLLLLCQAARGAIARGGFSSLRCFYPSSIHFRDPGLLAWSLSSRPGQEVIVHPAAVDDIAELGIADSYTSGRVLEYRALRMLATESELA